MSTVFTALIGLAKIAKRSWGLMLQAYPESLVGRAPDKKSGSGRPLYLFCPKAKKDAASTPHAVPSASLSVSIKVIYA